MRRQNNGNGLVYRVEVLGTFGYCAELEELYTDWNYRWPLQEGSYYVGQHWLPKGATPEGSKYRGSGTRIQSFCLFLQDLGITPLDVLRLDVLHWPVLTQEELSFLELEEIGDRYETDPLCLNNKEGGDRPIYSEELRERLSESMKEAWSDPELRARHSISLKRAYSNPEARKRNAEAQRRVWSDPENRARFLEAHAKALDKPEVQERRLERLRESMQRPEVRERLSDIAKKRFESPEARRQLGVSIREAYKNPDTRKRLSKAISAGMSNPDVRERLSKAAVTAAKKPEVKVRRAKAQEKRLSEKPLDVIAKAERLYSELSGSSNPSIVQTADGLLELVHIVGKYRKKVEYRRGVGYVQGKRRPRDQVIKAANRLLRSLRMES